MVGRYIKCLKSGFWRSYLKKGEYLKITKEKGNFIYFEDFSYGCFDKDRLTDRDKAFELMPENWTPNSENNILNTLELW